MSDIAIGMPVSTPISLQPEKPDLTANGGKNPATDRIDTVAKDFEAVFISQMMGAMFSGDELTSYFGGGSTGEIYKGFLMNEYGKAIASTGGIGIADQVKKELLTLQEAV